MRAAAIYARISDDRTGEGLAVSRQLADCEAEAARRGWTVAEVYVDDDISAHSGKARPAYLRMLEDLKDGTRDGVIAWHLDRLHRRPIELEHFANVCDAAQAKVATLHGDVDFGTGDGLMLARIMAAVAANESDAKSRRVRRKLDELAQAGLPHGGPRAFGYADDKITLVPHEAAIIRDLAERFLAGESLTSLATWLNDQGIPTSRGGAAWRTTALRPLLRSARISGQREHEGQVIGSAVWPAIITPEQTTRIRAILDDPSRRTIRTARRYFLTGMLRCGKCGTTLVAHPRRDLRRYGCRKGPDFGGCNGIYVFANPVEELIAKAVLYRLDTPELAQVLAGKAAEDAEAAALVDSIADDEAQLDELAGVYAAKAITVSEWLKARSAIEARIAAAKRTVAQRTNSAELARYIGQGNALREQWDSLNLNQQRTIARTVLDHAVIEPKGPSGGGFDPARVRPVWRL